MTRVCNVSDLLDICKLNHRSTDKDNISRKSPPHKIGFSATDSKTPVIAITGYNSNGSGSNNPIKINNFNCGQKFNSILSLKNFGFRNLVDFIFMR